MDSELLLKFIGYFPDYLPGLSRTLLRLFWTTFVETADDMVKSRHRYVVRQYVKDKLTKCCIKQLSTTKNSKKCPIIIIIWSDIEAYFVG